MMEKYLYLTQVEWAETWINGGLIPIKLASSYLSDTREGTMTPDENLIHKSEFPIPDLKQFGIELHNVETINIIDNEGIPNVINGSFYTEDGLILSFSNSFNIEIAKQLGKKACVKIKNIENLRKKIDRQLGCKGSMGICEYTDDHQRNHFLKSKEDAWQDEYRIFWKSLKEKSVKIPAGTAELIWKL